MSEVGWLVVLIITPVICISAIVITALIVESRK
jgi:hypothetical protein